MISPGTLRLIKGEPNPHGAEDTQLFLFAGNPTLAQIREIVPGEGVVMPPARLQPDHIVKRLKVFHINDLHGHIGRFTAEGDQPVLSRIVSRLREVRCQYAR